MLKRVFVVILTAAVIVSLSFSAFAQENKLSSKVISYYFHGAFRCPTCHKLERYLKDIMENSFKEALASGKLEFKVINIEDMGNEHYAKEYQLYTKSLILSLVKGGKEIKWKNLDKIWEYAGNKERFTDYVESGVSDFLGEAK
jgi:glutaredoxin